MSAIFSCREASRLVSEGQDRRLGMRERVSLRMHTMMCGACRAYAKQLSWLDGVLRGRREAMALGEEPVLDDSAKQRLKAGLHEAAQNGGKPKPDEPPSDASPKADP